MNKQAAGRGSIRQKTIIRKGKPYTYWEGRVTVGYDAGTGKQIQKTYTGKTQAEVKRKINGAVNSIDNNAYIAPQKTTVSEWLDKWFETYILPNVAAHSTAGAYRVIIKNHIKPAIGAMKLQDVKGIHIQRIINTLTESGKRSKTVHNVSVVMHKAFASAIDNGLLSVNPCDRVKLPPKSQQEIKPLSDSEIPLFLNAIKGDELENAFALCLFAGLREGECLGLSWDNVNFDANTITVKQQVTRDRRNGGYALIDHTKTRNTRTVTLPPMAMEYLQSEKRKQSENMLKAGSEWDNPHNIVFTDTLGNFLLADRFYMHFKKIVAKIGRPDARPHDLRHTAATVAIASGADIKSVQAMLGHASASFTLDVYAHLAEKAEAERANRLQNYFEDCIKRA